MGQNHVSRRHPETASLSSDTPYTASLYNNKTNREGRVIEKGNKVYVQIVDDRGEIVTQFERGKPAHMGFIGAVLYLFRGGYQ